MEIAIGLVCIEQYSVVTRVQSAAAADVYYLQPRPPPPTATRASWSAASGVAHVQAVGYPMPPECLWPLRPYAGGEGGSLWPAYSRAIETSNLFSRPTN